MLINVKNETMLVGCYVGKPVGLNVETIKTKSYGSFYLCNGDSSSYYNYPGFKLSGFKT